MLRIWLRTCMDPHSFPPPDPDPEPPPRCGSGPDPGEPNCQPKVRNLMQEKPNKCTFIKSFKINLHQSHRLLLPSNPLHFPPPPFPPLSNLFIISPLISVKLGPGPGTGSGLGSVTGSGSAFSNLLDPDPKPKIGYKF